MATFAGITTPPVPKDWDIAPGTPKDVLLALLRLEKNFQEEDSTPAARRAYTRREDRTGWGKYGVRYPRCTSSAEWLRLLLGRGEVRGYSTDENPQALVGQHIFGHDFLVVDGRWLVDWWAVSYAGEHTHIVIDMQKQPDLVRKYYGDPSTWTTLDAEGQCGVT